MGTPATTNSLRRLAHAIFLALLVCCGVGAPAYAQSAAVALQSPSAVAYDAQGNLYVAERAGHVVRRLAVDGTLTIIAGTGLQGFSGDNGPGTSAELDSPSGLALDSAGNVYISDTHNHRIRKLSTATGLITTVAGVGTAGFAGDNGPASSAQLYSPTALALDSAGNLYIADTGNQRVRRVAVSTGTITTIAGTGTQGLAGDNGLATAASLDSPAGLALDPTGNLYISDTHNGRVRRIAASTGIITTVAGSLSGPGLLPAWGDGSLATAATLALPRGLTVDSAGNVLIADSANQRIRRIAPDGSITTVAGQGSQGYSGDTGLATSAALDSPAALALSPAGQLVLADTANARIRQIDPSAEIRTVVGAGAALASPSLTLSAPASLIYGAGSLAASFSAGPSVTGAITFNDSATGAPVLLASVPIHAGVAVLNTSTLAAGHHTIVATYPGDATHTATQSQPLAINIAPLAITAVGQSASALFGQGIPPLSGTLNGVLPQDSISLSANFSTPAAALAPAGVYPITASLAGPAAANYILSSTTGTLTVSRAPTITALTSSASSPLAGASVTFTFQAISSTAGVPTGYITLLDGTSTLTQLPLASGSALYTSSTLGTGAHNITATYSGDPNFLPSTSVSSVLTVGSSADFSLAQTGSPSQSIPSGSSGTYSFSIKPQGDPLSSPINLAVSGLPTGVTASLNPAYIPPGGSATNFTLTVLTTKTIAATRPPSTHDRPSGPLVSFIALPPFVLIAGALGRRPVSMRFPRLFVATRTIFAVLLGITSATLASGCGDRVSTASETPTAPTYTLTVTATATSPTGAVLQHSVNVTLQVL